MTNLVVPNGKIIKTEGFQNMRGSRKPWGRAKELKAAKMRYRGASCQDIADEFNQGESPISVKFRITGFIYLTIEECREYGVKRSRGNKNEHVLLG